MGLVAGVTGPHSARRLGRGKSPREPHARLTEHLMRRMVPVESERWDRVLSASQRGRRIETQLTNLARDIDFQLGDDPEAYFILGEPADKKQREALRYILTRIESILA